MDFHYHYELEAWDLDTELGKELDDAVDALVDIIDRCMTWQITH